MIYNNIRTLISSEFIYYKANMKKIHTKEDYVKRLIKLGESEKWAIMDVEKYYDEVQRDFPNHPLTAKCNMIGYCVREYGRS